MNSHIAQKVLRDILCLKALGGTKELQKNVIFSELVREQDTHDRQTVPLRRAKSAA